MSKGLLPAIERLILPQGKIDFLITEGTMLSRLGEKVMTHIEKLHTSGHASTEFLAEVCNLVNPSLGIIPIHSEDSAGYSGLPIASHLRQRILTTSCDVDTVTIEIKQKSNT